MTVDLATILIGFCAAGAFVVFAGVHLTKAGDELGDLLNLGGTWVGLVILSAVTSLPELVSSIGGASWQGQPDLACGNIFGSNCFNVFIIALLDLYYRSGPISLRFGILPTFSGGLGILMTALGAAAILFNQPNFESSPSFPDWVWSALIVLGYLLSMVLLYRFEKRSFRESMESTGGPTVQAAIVGESALKPTVRKLLFASIGVVLAGLGMVYLADRLADYPFSFGTLGHTFVGAMGLATATSLPELVVGVTAIRMNRFDMAVGNVFGSNIFNILILAICQMVYTPFHAAPFYGGIAMVNLLSALLALALAGVAISGLVYRSERTLFGLGWDTTLITTLYIGGSYLLFLMGR